jgi:hypothetical protein
MDEDDVYYPVLFVGEASYPDGATPDVVDRLCLEIFGAVDPYEPGGDWLAARLDQVDWDRAGRREVRQVTSSVVRALGPRPVSAGTPTAGEAA